MIVGPNKGLFFAATALMCSASLYAELTAQSDPVIFTGEPNRLSSPPDFPAAPLLSLGQDENCDAAARRHRVTAALHNASTSSEEDCVRDAQPEPGAGALPRAVSAPSADAQAKVEPAGAGRNVQSH